MKATRHDGKASAAAAAVAGEIRKEEKGSGLVDTERAREARRERKSETQRKSVQTHAHTGRRAHTQAAHEGR